MTELERLTERETAAIRAINNAAIALELAREVYDNARAASIAATEALIALYDRQIQAKADAAAEEFEEECDDPEHEPFNGDSYDCGHV